MDDLLAVISNREALETVVKESEKKIYYGKLVKYDIWECVFESGLPPFDPNYHKPGQMRHAVMLTLAPLPSSNYTEEFNIKMVAETREWLNITLNSLTALGVSTLAQIKDKWLKYEAVPTRQYQAKDFDGQLTGETKWATAPKFMAVFNTDAEVESDADVTYNRGSNGGNAQSEQVAQPANNDARKQTAYNFLRYYVTQSKGNLEEIAKQIEANAILKEFYGEQGISHPDVVALVGELAEPEKPF